MSHGFSRILTDNPGLGGVDSFVMETPAPGLKYSELTDTIIGVFDNTRKKIRENPCESVAKVLA